MNELIQGLLILKCNLTPHATQWNVSTTLETIIISDVDIEKMSLRDVQILYKLGFLLGDSRNDAPEVETVDGETFEANPDDVEEWDEETWDLVKEYFDNTFTFIL